LAKSVYSPSSFISSAFRNDLGDRNSNLRILNGNDLSIGYWL